jgi:hypothetical protein
MSILHNQITGYTYKADNYCPTHIIDSLATYEGGMYEGWELAPGAYVSAEDTLDEIAYAFHIDRLDEDTFDSGDFPKVILDHQATWRDHCCVCGSYLDGCDRPCGPVPKPVRDMSHMSEKQFIGAVLGAALLGAVIGFALPGEWWVGLSLWLSGLR